MLRELSERCEVYGHRQDSLNRRKKRRGSRKDSSKNDEKEMGEAVAIPLRRKCKDEKEV